MNELSLLKVCMYYNVYNTYKEEIDLSYIKENFRELSYLFNVLIVLLESVKRDVSVDELASAFFVKYPDADKGVYNDLLERLRSLQMGEDVGSHVLAEIKRGKALLKLSETAYKVKQGLAQPEDLQNLWKNYDLQNTPTGGILLPFERVSTSLEDLADKLNKDQGMRWRLDCLNKSLGSLRDGDFGFIFARPETGKTTFLASETSGMLRGCTRPFIWFNNEEQGYKVMFRVYQAYFGITLEAVLANKRRWEEQFRKETQDRFWLFDEAKIHRRDVEAVVKELNPALVIYDQLPKITGFNADRKDLELGAIFQWARELSKGSHAAIGVSQADGTAEGVRYLTMEHVANVKTAVQAEADWMLGIGKIHDPGAEYVRYLNISKNKLIGDDDSLPDLRHGRFETIIQPQIARYKDIIKYE
jgi:KaiC/GvpD/RAD55 family RecA-like ATPase